MKLDAALQLSEMIFAKGKMPITDEHGNLNGEFEEVPILMRGQHLRHYIDKALPNENVEGAGHEAIPASEAQQLLDDEEALDEMTDSELMSLDRLRDMSDTSERPETDTENPWG